MVRWRLRCSVLALVLVGAAPSPAAIQERAGVDRQEHIVQLEQQLEKHAFFSKIGWTRLDDVEGFVVFVQDPKRHDPEYALRVARQHAGSLVALRRHFEEAYVGPARLARRADYPFEVLFVLSSAADLRTYAELEHAPFHYATWMQYDGKLRMVVLCEDPFETRPSAAEITRAARHAYAHLLLHAHDSRARVHAQEDWLREGFASYLAGLAEDRAGRLSAPELHSEALRRLLAASQSRDKILTHLRRIGDLLGAQSFEQVATRALADARRAGLDAAQIDWEELFRCYGRQTLFLVDFLQRGERRAGFLRLLADELRGEGGLPAFQSAFPGTRLEELDRAFLEHLFAEHRRLMPRIALDDAAIEAVLAQDASLVPLPEPRIARPPVEAAPAQPPPVAPRPRPFEPADLAPTDLEPEAALALALDLARRGRSGAAQARLAALLEGELPAERRERIARAHDQIGAWNQLRSAWFGDLAARGAAYRLEHEGRTLRVGIERVEEDTVHLAPNRSGRDVLLLDELDPADLARQMGREASGLPAGWARVLPALLAGDRRAARGLDANDPLQGALAADLAGDLPHLLARGLVLGELDELSRSPLPRDGPGCEALLERLAAIVQGHGEVAEVDALRPQLRMCARAALAVLFDDLGPRQLVRGALQELENGRVRLAYDFRDPAQLEDFVRADDHLLGRRKGLGELSTQRHELRIRNGALTGLGESALRHRLGFTAPLQVRYGMKFHEAPGVTPAEIWFLVVGICDDDRGNYAAALGFCDLEVIAGGRIEHAYAVDRPLLYLDTVYRMELIHDGVDKVRFSMDDRLREELPTRGLTGGGFFLMWHSDYLVSLSDLVIEGALDPGLLAEARAAWIEERLAERGL